MFFFEIIGKAEAGNNMSEFGQNFRKWIEICPPSNITRTKGGIPELGQKSCPCQGRARTGANRGVYAWGCAKTHKMF